MMDSNCEAGDDQGSGWLEVKKKHRSSPKYSSQGLVGGFSNRRPSSSSHNQSSGSSRNGNVHSKGGKCSRVGQEFARHGQVIGDYSCSGLKQLEKADDDSCSGLKQGDKISRVAQEFARHGHDSCSGLKQLEKAGDDSSSGSKQVEKAIGNSCSSLKEVEKASDNSCSGSKEVEKVVDCLDKCVVNEAGELPKSSPFGTEPSMDTTGETRITQKEKLDVVIPKIKWGDLEDDALLLCGANSEKITFGNLGHDDTLLVEKNGDGSSSNAFQEDKAVLTSLDMSDNGYENNSTEISGISSHDVAIADSDEKVAGRNNVVLPINCDAPDGLDFDNVVTEKNLSTDANGVSKIVANQPEDKFEDGYQEIAEIVTCGNDTVLSPILKSGSEASDAVPEASDDLSVAPVEDLNQSQDGTENADLSEVPFMNAMGDGDSGESKERFRERLWCFLFENLNRAVDELYLLCELECDLEQMKEALLVLEEAGSDFRELKSRVEGFEKAKKSSQPSLDGLPMSVTADHRRPHTFSWEVRRMTSSAHRAEILSSSLEAFKKIQNERATMNPIYNVKTSNPVCENPNVRNDPLRKSSGRDVVTQSATESITKLRKKSRVSDHGLGNMITEKRNIDGGRSSKVSLVQNSCHTKNSLSICGPSASHLSLKDSSAAGKCNNEPLGSASDLMKQQPRKDKISTEIKAEKTLKYMDPLKRHIPLPDKEKEKDKRNTPSWKDMDAWKEKRNWEDILASPLRGSSRVSHSPGMSRKSVERARVLHDKLMSPEKKKKTALDLKKEAEEKHARAMRIRSELENERAQKLQRTSEKLNRVNEWQAVRNLKLREGMHARHQRGESRHEAHLAQVVRRAGDESSKVNEVRFITSLNEDHKKFILRQKLQESEQRRAEKMQIIKSKQKEDMAREEAVLERRRLLEAEKLQRLADIQRKKEVAQVRKEEERKASSAAREARAIEQLRRKEVRAKAQQEEAELLAQKLAERLRESEHRRKVYLEQIRERASMDFRDQSSPLLRRSLNKESLGRSISASNIEDYQSSISGTGCSSIGSGNTTMQNPLKRRIKKIRQRLMALKYEFPETPVSAESTGIGYRAQLGTARAKIGRWVQELQRLRQARKEGAASIGLIVADMIKYMEGKEPELNASRQARLLDFIASALPASHTSKPEACQVTIYLLRLLKVVLSIPSNRSYFLAQNLLPPIIPMLSAALENYIKIAASLGVPGTTNPLSSKTSPENFETVSEVLEGFVWTVTTIIGHVSSDEKQLQMQDGLLELVIAYQVIHRLRDLFALYDRPQVEGSPFSSSIILSLNLLAVLTSKPRPTSSIDWESFPSKVDENQESKLIDFADLGDTSLNAATGDNRFSLSVLEVIAEQPLLDGAEDCKLVDMEKELMDAPGEARKSPAGRYVKLPSQKDEINSRDISAQKSENNQGVKQPVAFLLSVVAETGLVSLPSLLTAVLLQANTRLSTDQALYVLPSNFEEVATGVLKVLNNLALLDIKLMQRMLARPDLKMEFFHLMSFLLTHCTNKWRVASDQVGLLLLESLLLLGYFALFHSGNQAVLRWGKSPTILHKVCDLPFMFFSDPELMPILAGTLVAACYGCEQNKDVVQQELSIDMLLSLLKSCKNGLFALQSDLSPPLDNISTADDPCEVSHQSGPEPKRFQGELSAARSSRYNSRNIRLLSSGKAGPVGSSSRGGKMRNHKDNNKPTKTCEDWAVKHNLPAAEASSSFMLHSRFPSAFIDKAEEFFSSSNDASIV
ncbi:hypothetical protein C5167_022706 [Papaver somniferum]|uniref:S phase cyclin A-associated protein in the endoplasmic reticulum N-terminal domain-containing protein n=1 Tax=Papaver somniferum TaxID=3469 RepID=A0A4Y7JMD5_PAPSO|nr:uncharacterized protein LOC113281763 [Papaver somniferum]XP_026386389.1 uncharacterized protein LOC113281763 [Papaver somniferum]RZC60938.1 hypothetical protein C5167_022706 [Papaver somniferum]